MFKYAILGIVQGLTEFLPVSSSGHLVILQRIFAMHGEELVLSLVLHLGTALALIVFFFKDILAALRNLKTLFLILVVTFITGLIALLGKDFFKQLFSSPRLAAISLIFTGIILILTKRFMVEKKNTLTLKDAIALGFAQGIAIIPGISRSGITISTLLFRRINRDTSFRFSFLACLPAIFGAVLLEAKDIGLASRLEISNFIIGFIFSFLTGILALGLLKIALHKAKLYYFGYYCIIIAVLTLIFIK